MTNYIALAIPFFFLCIGVEIVAARALKRNVYRFGDALTDLGCGIASQLAVVFSHAWMLAAYLYLYDRHRLFSTSASSLWPWVFTFFALDFIYYWWHRLSHEVNFLWAAHVVHHSSEDYNLAVALRQAITTSFTIIPFFFPLALLGIPPVVYVTIHSFNTLYQFWIHTQLVGKLGPVEVVLNTPSQHRVHHAINPRYLDKNYGGTLMIWDRIFGTFEPETEPCVYGIVKPLESYNPFTAQFHHWFTMARSSLAAPLWVDKFRLWWRSPAWTPAGLTPYPLPEGVTPESFHKYDPPVSRGISTYLFLQFAVLVTVMFFLMFNQEKIAGPRLWAPAAYVVLTLFATGAFLERRTWALAVEGARLLVLAGAVGVYLIL